MKKKSAFLVIICLFLGAVFTQISAQKTIQGKTTSYFLLDVYCDGEVVDHIGGMMRTHWVFHSGQGFWQILQIKGTAYSTDPESTEEFKYIETDRKDLFLDPWVVMIHYNLKGNQGSHYVGTAWADLTDLDNIVYTPIKTKCK
jgi:hypothetical protein